MKQFISVILLLFLFGILSPGKDKRLDSLFQAGTANLYNGNYDEAFSNFFERKLLSEQLRDSLTLAQSLTYLGEVCRATEDFDLGLNYLYEALTIASQIRDSFSVAKAFNRMSAIKFEQRDLDASLKFARQSLNIFQRLHESNLSANNMNILGAIFTVKKDYATAIEYYDQSRQIMLTLDDQSDLPNILNNIANNYFLSGQFQKGLPYAEESFQLASKNKTRVYMLEACRMLLKGYQGLGNFEKALQYSELASSLNVELSDEFKKAEKTIIELRHQNELATKENIFLKQINDENQRLIKLQRKLFWISVAGLIILSILLIMLFIFYRQRRNNLKILSEKNRLVENQKEDLQKLNHVKDSLFALISHDFRSPLISLDAMLQLLEIEAGSKEELSHITQRMKQQVYATIETLDSMLLWSRTQMEGTQIKRASLDLRQFSDEIIKTFLSELSAKNLVMENNIHKGLTIITDHEMLRIILRNLLSNAIKFSHQGGTIFLFVEQTNSHVEISVRDLGTGISPQVKQKLFASEHVSTEGTQNEKGIGIGLILIHELVSKLAGSIQVHSETNMGSTFTITLPV
ncbi:MAG TPA: tetratricopeptide repeat-containing sensor histidine kinase [Chitinophagales bacterium]|nr:tetratricopeptide repeat-containing sensor histidine kinase [Chitinophagales bacterium]